MNARLTRRSFLLLAAGVVAGGAAAAARLFREEEWTGPAATVAALFDDPEEARKLGQAYLEEYPGENDVELLIQQIDGPAGGFERALRAGDTDAVRRLIRPRAAHESANDQLITVDAWLVAPTEARLAAILAAS